MTVKDILRRSPSSGPDSFAKWTDADKQLNREWAVAVNSQWCSRFTY